MRILFVGDIVGSPGRQIVNDRLADIVSQRQIDLVIANGENAASGFGITPRLADELLGMGIDVLTGGNHSWTARKFWTTCRTSHACCALATFLKAPLDLARSSAPQRTGVKYAVLNLQGRVFLTPIDDPFAKPTPNSPNFPLTWPSSGRYPRRNHSEKIAMGWYLDGRVTAVVGTHTHVTTADERILPQGTAYITDVGMTGPHGGVIGMDREGIIKRFLDGTPARFEVAAGDVANETAC